MRVRMGWKIVAALAAGLGGAALAADLRAPMGQAGPYQVLIDRITANRDHRVQFPAPGKAPGQPLTSTRLVQFQIGLFSRDTTAAAGLTTFELKSVTAEVGGRIAVLSHFGGVLESPNDKALVRAYFYMPNFPLRPKEIRSVNGEIVSYERAVPLEINVPLAGKRLPLTIEQDGVKVTLHDLTVDGGNAQIALTLDAAPGCLLVNTVNDGTYGVALYGDEDRVATPNGGTAVQPRPNQADYRLSFGTLNGMPTRVQAKILLRAGQRHVYPFHLEHVPLPDALE